MKKTKVNRVCIFSIRMSDIEKERLEALRVKLSPYAPVSQGRAVVAAVELALKLLEDKQLTN